MTNRLNPYLAGAIAALVIACLAANAEANDDPLCDSICRYAERRTQPTETFRIPDKPASEVEADLRRDQRQLLEDVTGTFEPRHYRQPRRQLYLRNQLDK
jgi:hypothetical protein